MFFLKPSFLNPLLMIPLVGLFFYQAQPARADLNDQQMLINKSKVAVDGLRDQFKQPLDGLLRRAKGVLVYPSIIKAGFFVGASGGVGTLLVRGSDGTWSPPAFYGFVSGSIGLQFGASGSEVIMVIMTDGALARILRDEIKLGADASVAVGPVGAGVQAASTTNLDADMYVYSKSAGLFAGGAIDGAMISSSPQRNKEYYGPNATSVEAIVMQRQFNNPGADALRNALVVSP